MNIPEEKKKKMGENDHVFKRFWTYFKNDISVKKAVCQAHFRY